VGSGWRHGRRPRRRGQHPGQRVPIAGVLARKPDSVGCSLNRCAGTVRTLAPWIGCTGASKSHIRQRERERGERALVVFWYDMDLVVDRLAGCSGSLFLFAVSGSSSGPIQ